MSAVMQDWLPRHRYTADEFYRMAEAGLFAPDDRVELIEGEIIDMAPIGDDHMCLVDQLNYTFMHAVGDKAIVRIQGAVQLSDRTVPQPDLVLLKPRADFYKGRRASIQDVFLIIEVSDTTFRLDRKVKLPVYGRVGVPEVWIVDVNGEQVHFFRSLRGQEYSDISVASNPGVTPVPGLPGVTVDLSKLLLKSG